MSIHLHQLLQLGVIGTLLVVISALWWSYGTEIRARLERRFLAGVPWGTIIVIGLLLAVYLFIQGGVQHWYDPVTLPFHSWSYLYPLGMIIAPLAHQGPGHLQGNVSATVLLASIAEYAWGHFTNRYNVEGGSVAWWHRPRVRAGVIFPASTIGAGLATSFLGWGPIIGFSGVVYAFAGFALV